MTQFQILRNWRVLYDRLPWLVRGGSITALWMDPPFDHIAGFEEPYQDLNDSPGRARRYGGGCKEGNDGRPVASKHIRFGTPHPSASRLRRV